MRNAAQAVSTAASQDQAPAPAPAPAPPAAAPAGSTGEVTPSTTAGNNIPTPPGAIKTDSSTLDQNLAQATKTSQAIPAHVQEVAQSEPTPNQPAQGPNTGRPVVDPRPLAVLAEHDPARYKEVVQVAQQEGISPARLAAHWKQESNFSYNPPTNPGDGHGPMQVLPSTAKDFNDHGNLNLEDPHDNLQIGAKYIRHLDDTYGRDSVSSVGAYQGGEGSANDIAKNPDAADRNHPQTMAYVRNIMQGYDINGKHFTSGGQVDPATLVKTGVQQGPDGVLKYITQSAPGMNMTDAWQHAESALVKSFLNKGNIEGAQHARDFVLQMSHQGSNMHLMAAHQAMMNGDTTGAAQNLAAAHAFFPDGTMGQFGVDKSGNLWGARMDEHDPTKMQGQPFRITPDGIAQMLNQTQDPNKYLTMMMQERTSAANVRHLDKMGDYYSGLLDEKNFEANLKSQTSLSNASTRADATTGAAQIRADARTNGTGPGGQIAAAANKEATGLYGPYAMTNEKTAKRAQLS